ncbi:MAG: hypothetical protein K0S41_3383 [Anaerocolumna sp.]|jgi:hypothetical protein|nr:hypothetical protein [Anaerocolumna sp.]
MFHIEAYIYNIDYKYLLDYWLPRILENNSNNSLSLAIIRFLLISNHKPNFVAKQLASGLPQELKDTITAKLISTADDKIIDGLNEAIRKNYLTIEVKKMKIRNMVKGGKSMLKIELTLSEINYNELVERMIPTMLENLEKKDSKIATILSDMGNIPVQMITAALNVLTQEQKNELIAKIVATYNEDISKAVSETMKKQHIAVDIKDILVKNV